MGKHKIHHLMSRSGYSYIVCMFNDLDIKQLNPERYTEDLSKVTCRFCNYRLPTKSKTIHWHDPGRYAIPPFPPTPHTTPAGAKITDNIKEVTCKTCIKMHSTAFCLGGCGAFFTNLQRSYKIHFCNKPRCKLLRKIAQYEKLKAELKKELTRQGPPS